jgi:hypothetical protein
MEMTTREHMENLAVRYANALVRYHELTEHCKTSDLREDQRALRYATDDMFELQTMLSRVCHELALEEMV